MEYKFTKSQFNGTKFLRLIESPLKEKIYATTHVDGLVTIFVKEELSTEEINLIQQIVDTHDPSPDSPLKIYNFIHPDLDHRTTDFTIVGLKKSSPRYDRGRKVEADYIDPETKKMVVRKVFTDQRDVETGILTGLLIDFEWYKENGEVGDTKTELVKEYNEWEAETIERQRRQKQKDFLVREGKRSGAEAYMTMLLHYFSEQISDYIALGSNAWAEALKAHMPKFINDDPTGEPDQSAIETQIYGILTAKPEGNLSIKEAILYQITGSVS